MCVGVWVCMHACMRMCECVSGIKYAEHASRSCHNDMLWLSTLMRYYINYAIVSNWASTAQT